MNMNLVDVDLFVFQRGEDAALPTVLLRVSFDHGGVHTNNSRRSAVVPRLMC